MIDCKFLIEAWAVDATTLASYAFETIRSSLAGCAFRWPLRRRWFALLRWPYYKGERRILAGASWGKVLLLLASTRRKFLRSLCRSALGLPLEKILDLTLPSRM